MLLVGLTGGIGCGKSTVSALLGERGAVVVDADQVARDLQAPGSPLVAAMAERFGPGVVRADGSLDRPAVAAIVFGDTPEAVAARADLNAITAPVIQAEILARIAAHAASDAIVVLDHPLLAEPRAAAPYELAEFVVVDLPVDEAVRRLVEYRGMDEVDARNRIASQVSREDRLAQATYVVDNSGGRDALEPEVDRLWAHLLTRAERSD